jgi:cob(I)alamin adenosyltransferase
VKVYTRRGDTGETDLFGSGRVPKDHPRVEAYGTVDELNAALGVCAAATGHEDLRDDLQGIQRACFALGAVLATPEPRHQKASGMPAPGASDVGRIEARIDALEAELSPLERFVLPGGTPAAAALHVARTTCRRAERGVVELHRVESVDPVVLCYLNRLSDLLFVMARVENRRAGVPDVEWEGRSG